MIVMGDDKADNKPSNRAKNTLFEYRVRELMEKEKETLAKYSAKLEIEYKKLEKKYEGALKEIEKLKAEKENAKKERNKYEGYDKSKELLEKIVFILKRNKAGMSFTEVKDTLLSLEPELKYRWGNPNKSITHLLSKGCKFAVLVRSHKFGSYGTFVYTVSQGYV